MNPHRITLKYMGWCPGFNRVSNYMPDTDYKLNYRIIAASIATIFSLLAIFSAQFFIPPPVTINGQLQVYIRDNNVQKVFNDGDFNQTFNYALFQGDDYAYRAPHFIQENDETDFAKGDISITDYEFDSLSEVNEFTSRLNTPNCLNQYIRWLLKQNYTNTMGQLYNSPQRKAAALMRGYTITYLGDVESNAKSYGVRYYVQRGNYFGGDTGPGTLWEGDKNIADGVLVEKYNSQDMIWRLFIEGGFVYNSERYPTLEPVFKVRLIRFPAGNGFTSKWSMG